jgi:hypothetical protein
MTTHEEHQEKARQALDEMKARAFAFRLPESKPKVFEIPMGALAMRDLKAHAQ